MVGRLILVVEDDEDIRDTIASVLREESYRVETAPHGLDALGFLARESALPSVILLDLMMPMMSGREFRERQRADARIAGVPVVILTGDPRASDISAELGASAWIRKPVGLSELLATIERVAGAARPDLSSRGVRGS